MKTEYYNNQAIDLIEVIPVDDMEGDITKVISMLQSLQNKNRKEYTEISLSFVTYTSYDGDSDYFHVNGYRAITEDEKKKIEDERIENEKRTIEQVEAELNRLKAAATWYK